MSASDSTIQPAALGWPGRAWRPYALALPALILLIAVIGYPLLTIVLRSLSEPEWGVQNYAWFFGAPVNLTVLRRTFTISAWVTLVCVVSAYP
ncbi:ABC transporter permease, partial [Mesorhizobium sp. M4A.F.Ca.ET.050.02.1.1]